jgi:hypothetical protein
MLHVAVRPVVVGLLILVATAFVAPTTPALAQTVTGVSQEWTGLSNSKVTLTGSDLSKIKSVSVSSYPVSIGARSNTSLTFTVALDYNATLIGFIVPIVITGADGKPQTLGDRFQLPIATSELAGPYVSTNPRACDTQWLNQSGAAFNQPSASGCVEAQDGIMGYAINFDLIDMGAWPVNSDSPTFHILVQKDLVKSAAPADEALFQVVVFECEIPEGTQPAFATPTGINPYGPGADPKVACKNWDGNTGYWKELEIDKGKLGEQGGKTIYSSGFADLSINIDNLFNRSKLVSTLLFDVVVTDQCHNQICPTDPGLSFPHREGATFKKVTVVRPPVARASLNVLPYALFYAPPGDMSTSKVTLTDQYVTNYTLTNIKGDTLTITNENISQVNASLTFGASPDSATGSVMTNNSTTTSNAIGNTATKINVNQAISSLSSGFTLPGSPTTTPGSGATCQSETVCSPQIQNANAYQIEPFWGDTFQLLVNPQFAVWEQLAGQVMTVMTDAAPVLAQFNVAELYGCASGVQPVSGINSCQADFDATTVTVSGAQSVYNTQSTPLILSATDAANLLKLDPFYGVGQNPKLSTERFSLVGPKGGYSYGAQVGAKNTPFTSEVTLTNTEATTGTGTSQTQYTSTVTNVESTAMSLGYSLSDGYLGFGVSGTSTYQWTSGSQTQLTFSNSTAVTKQKTSTLDATLKDEDNLAGGDKNGHGPLPEQPVATVFLDNSFGAFAFVDPTAPGPPAGVASFPKVVVGGILAHERRRDRFADVPSSRTDHDAIGLAQRARWLPATSEEAAGGSKQADFHPDDLMTRADFAAVLVEVKGLSAAVKTAPRTATFTDVAVGVPAQIVNTVLSKGYMQLASPTLFQPAAPLLQPDLAEALAAAFSQAAATPRALAAPRMAVDKANTGGTLSGGAQPTTDKLPVTRGEAMAALVQALIASLP